MTDAAPAEPVAGVPMNDWSEVAPAWDAIWRAVRDRLREAGIPAPGRLRRDLTGMALWRHPGLVLGLTCGLPYVRGLRERAALVGTPDFGVPGCPPGWYRSALLVRADEPREALAAFRGARLAVNGADSQSGAQAMMFALRAIADGGAFFGEVRVTGAHEFSAAEVADGRADIAAVDYTTWRLICAFRPGAADLRVLALTEPNPGLPLVAAPRRDGPHAAVPAVVDAVAAGIAEAPPEARDALRLRGLVRTSPADYDLIAARAGAARQVSRAHGL